MDRSLAARLPRRDVAMAAILLAVMLAADIVALMIGLPEDRPPGTLTRAPAGVMVVWIGYFLSLQFHAWRSRGDAAALAKVAGFVGPILSLLASVLVVAHLVSLANLLWFDALSREQLARAWMSAVGVIVIVLYNRAPKILTIAPDSPLAGLRLTRLGAWAGIASGLGIAITAWIAPLQQIRFYCLGLALLAAAVLQIERLRTRRRGSL